jgi:hypothetical protein
MSAVVLAIQRDTYLPFLGHTVMPEPITGFTQAETLISKKISGLPPNVKVMYWAALPSETVIDNPSDAYGDYSNQGVTKTDDNGTVKCQSQPSVDDPLGLKIYTLTLMKSS